MKKILLLFIILFSASYSFAMTQITPEQVKEFVEKEEIEIELIEKNSTPKPQIQRECFENEKDKFHYSEYVNELDPEHCVYLPKKVYHNKSDSYYILGYGLRSIPNFEIQNLNQEEFLKLKNISINHYKEIIRRLNEDIKIANESKDNLFNTNSYSKIQEIKLSINSIDNEIDKLNSITYEELRIEFGKDYTDEEITIKIEDYKQELNISKIQALEEINQINSSLILELDEKNFEINQVILKNKNDIIEFEKKLLFLEESPDLGIKKIYSEGKFYSELELVELKIDIEKTKLRISYLKSELKTVKSSEIKELYLKEINYSEENLKELNKINSLELGSYAMSQIIDSNEFMLIKSPESINSTQTNFSLNLFFKNFFLNFFN